ncbi:MAG TPA: hypothetical protein VFV71_09285 [Burkholderiales bacterium]|nr:hypothetical protein [Burkholderiales bacterium]
MIRKFAAITAFAVAAFPAFAETGVSTVQIDNVSNVYGRAGVPAVKISGAVVTHEADVNASGRGYVATSGVTTAVLSVGEAVDQTLGRS